MSLSTPQLPPLVGQAIDDDQIAEVVAWLTTSPDREACTEAMIRAAGWGNAPMVAALLPFSDPKSGNSMALSNAAADGHVECVQLLLPLSEPSSSMCLALLLAAESGHADCVRVLIPGSNLHDPNGMSVVALNKALLGGHEDCVQWLWPVADRAWSLRQATRLGQWRVADRLIQAFPLQEQLDTVREAPPGSFPVTRARLEKMQLQSALDQPAPRSQAPRL